MRLIDADALINDIEEFITEHEEMMKDSEEHPENYPEDYKTRVLNLIAGLIAAKVEVASALTIDAVPVKHGKWIPCSERLPEDGVAVLITTENGEVDIDQVITDPYKERYFQSNTAYDNFQVIAWMPLPERYREDNQ